MGNRLFQVRMKARLLQFVNLKQDAVAQPFSCFVV
jgi:hypothetical protein